MGYLDNFFKAQNKELHQDWKVLTGKEQLDKILEVSFDKPAVIFKHSTRCGVSSMALYQLEKDWSFQPEELDFYFLDLIAHRRISNAVAESLGVVHHSPQIILIKNGKAVYNTSHHMISAGWLRQALEDLPADVTGQAFG